MEEWSISIACIEAECFILSRYFRSHRMCENVDRFKDLASKPLILLGIWKCQKGWDNSRYQKSRDRLVSSPCCDNPPWIMKHNHAFIWARNGNLCFPLDKRRINEFYFRDSSEKYNSAQWNRSISEVVHRLTVPFWRAGSSFPTDPNNWERSLSQWVPRGFKILKNKTKNTLHLIGSINQTLCHSYAQTMRIIPPHNWQWVRMTMTAV